jgi:hypothetical protein
MSDRRKSQMFFIDSPAVSMLACPEEIWEKIFSFIQRPADRSSISQVCTQFYSCEARTREKVLISSCYAIDPEVVAKRFPFATAFSIKGKPRIVDFSVIPDANKWGAYATPWVTFFAQHYPFLSQLKLKRMSISNDDLQILVQGCGESLQVLEFEKCSGFSTIGLQSIAEACRYMGLFTPTRCNLVSGGAEQLHSFVVEAKNFSWTYKVHACTCLYCFCLASARSDITVTFNVLLWSFLLQSHSHGLQYTGTCLHVLAGT